MTEIIPSPLLQTPRALDSSALQTLARRFLAETNVPDGWKPKKRIETYVAEAFHLAALIDDSPSRLLPTDAARGLRERALAARVLDHRARRLRSSRSRARAARATRLASRHYLREVVSALRYLAGLDPSGVLSLRLRRLEPASTDDGLAMLVHHVLTIAYEERSDLEELGVTLEFIESGYQLATDLRMISARQNIESLERLSSTQARDHVLCALSQKLQSTRATLRYVHRNDPEFLARISR